MEEQHHSYDNCELMKHLVDCIRSGGKHVVAFARCLDCNRKEMVIAPYTTSIEDCECGGCGQVSLREIELMQEEFDVAAWEAALKL